MHKSSRAPESPGLSLHSLCRFCALSPPCSHLSCARGPSVLCCQNIPPQSLLVSWLLPWKYLVLHRFGISGQFGAGSCPWFQHHPFHVSVNPKTPQGLISTWEKQELWAVLRAEPNREVGCAGNTEMTKVSFKCFL